MNVHKKEISQLRIKYPLKHTILLNPLVIQVVDQYGEELLSSRLQNEMLLSRFRVDIHQAYEMESMTKIVAKVKSKINMTETLGTKRMGAQHDPSKNEVVDQIRNKAANLHDMIDSLLGTDEISGEKRRLVALAQTHLQTAKMFAVEANYTK